MSQKPSLTTYNTMSTTASSMWDLSPCSEFALACRRSGQETVSNDGLRPAYHGTSHATSVDFDKLNKVLYDLRKSAGKFNAPNEPFKVRLHGFARKSTMSLRGGASPGEEDEEVELSTIRDTNALGAGLGSFARLSVSTDEHSSSDESNISSKFSTSFIKTPPTSESEDDDTKGWTQVAEKASKKEQVKLASAAEVASQPAQVGQKKVLHSRKISMQYLVAEYVANACHQRNKKSSGKTLETTTLIPAPVVVSYGLAKKRAQQKRAAIAHRFVARHHLAGTVEGDAFINATANVGTNKTEGGIHVFVDASNINIGFLDALKTASGVDLNTKCDGNGALSFDRLAFILERGRKVAQHEIVGSVKADGIMAKYMYEAEEMDWKVSAPQIVRKVKATRQGMKAANTEQLVDELIHLKMSTAINRIKKPSTMVLATGDANVAEYSDGFAAYAHDALEKGWKVEIISWKKGLSNVWRKMQQADPDNLKIIFLDDYRHELANEAMPGDWWANGETNA